MRANTRSSRMIALSVAVIAVCALAGCGFDNGEGLPTLDRERTAADALPSAIVSQLDDDDAAAIDSDTVRLAGDYKGAQFYIARAMDERRVCLVIFVDAETWTWGCHDSRDATLSVQGGYSVRLTRDGVVPMGKDRGDNDGWVALTDDVLVRKGDVTLHTGPQS